MLINDDASVEDEGLGGSSVRTTRVGLQPCKECEERNAFVTSSVVDRRTFVSRSALAAASALLAGACAGGSNTTGPGGTPGGNGTLSVTIANYPTLGSVGGIARVDTGQGIPVAAVRTSATTFAAFSLICPHYGCTVGIAPGSFACPCHGARFASNGQWTGGQSTGNLSSLNASYDPTSGVLTITG